MVRKHQTPGAQLRTGESRDSGFMLRMPRNDKRNREPEQAGFSPDCPSQMLAPRPRSGAVLTDTRSRFSWRETDMTGARPLSRRLRHLAAAMTIGAASIVASAPAFARGPDGIADIAEKVIDAVVNISTSQTVEAKGGGGGGGGAMPQMPPGSPFEEFFDDFFKNRRGGPGGKGGENGREFQPRKTNSLGSGFIIDTAGIVVTNNHVIADADEINVIPNDGTRSRPSWSASTRRPTLRC